jgi:hypothetical protein
VTHVIHTSLRLLILLLFPVFALGAGFDDRFIASNGDLNGDGLKDIYVRQKPRIVPIPLDDISIPIQLEPDVQPFVLQQRPDGTFSVISPLSSQLLGQVRQWPAVALNLLSSDLNVDGFRDLILKGVSTAAVGSFDQIVFADPTSGDKAHRARRIDPDLITFMTDAYRWQKNEDYFEVASLENEWYEIIRGEEFRADWSLAYLLFWGYTAANGDPLVLSFEAASDPNQTPPACEFYNCYFDFIGAVWRVDVVAREMRLEFDNFNEHFNNDAVTYGRGVHSSLDVLAQIISGKLQVEVGGGEKILVANDETLQDVVYKDLLLNILLHDNYCAITLECEVTIQNVSSVDMIVNRQGTGSYFSSSCEATLNFTHGTYQITGTNGASLNGFTLERGGPDSRTPASNNDKCNNKPKRIPQGTYGFTVGNTRSYRNVPTLVTASVNRTGVLVHDATGAAGSIGCILVSKTSGAAGTFGSSNASSLAALNEIRAALTYQANGVRKFLFNEGRITINNNGN